MKTIHLLIFTVLSQILFSQELNLATFNLRYKNDHDIGNLWKDRLPVIIDMVKFYDWDILGTQEVLKDQLSDLNKNLPDYEYYGIGRDEKGQGEHSAIFFRKDKFTLKDSGTFWLSETPEKVSKGWDAKLNRICSWVKLSDNRNGKIFFVFNTHFDHEANIARLESSKLILKKINEIAKQEPVSLLGDMNSGRDTAWFKNFKNSKTLKESYVEAPIKLSYNGTFNNFGKTIESREIIDHIFFTKEFKPLKYAILSNNYFGKYPSDHFPVMAIFEWENNK